MDELNQGDNQEAEDEQHQAKVNKIVSRDFEYWKLDDTIVHTIETCSDELDGGKLCL